MAISNTSIKGTYVYQGQRSKYEERYVIDAAIRGSRISGTWQDSHKRTGKVSGIIKAEAELARANAFTAGKDWPCWSGPFTSLAAAPCNLKLVEDFNKEARLVWRSEERIPQGNGNALNYHPLALTDRTMGGGASLVMGEGKVFACYYQPSGKDYMKIVNRDNLSGIAGDRYVEEQAKKEGLDVSPFMLEKFLIRADDVIVCMDAATGKTLWKNVFAGKSMNQPSHKGGAVNNTPCIGEGRVFARGAGGRLYGIEIATGKVLWELPGMSAEQVRPWSGARNMCTAPIHVGGTLIVPDNGSTLYGLDPASGKQRWKLPGVSNRFQVPSKWVHGGREYVISMTAGTRTKERGLIAHARCLDPEIGKPLWEIELPPNPTKGISVYGDRMYVTANRHCAAYRLDLHKAEQLWSVPAPYAAVDSPPAVNGKYVAVGGPKESHLLDAATGKDLATYTGPGPFNEGYAAFIEDRVILSLDGSHGHSDMIVLGGTPGAFKKLCHWVQPHPQTTSYHNKFMTFPMVEGRIFMRGYDGVYCYDLRKPPK